MESEGVNVDTSKKEDAVPYGNSARELVASQETLLYTLQNLQYELLKTDNETTMALEDIKCRIASVHIKSSSFAKLSNASGNPKPYLSNPQRRLSQQFAPVALSSRNIPAVDFKPRDYSTDLSSAGYASSVSFSDCDFSTSAAQFSDEASSSGEEETEASPVVVTPKRKKPLTILR